MHACVWACLFVRMCARTSPLIRLMRPHHTSRCTQTHTHSTRTHTHTHTRKCRAPSQPPCSRPTHTHAHIHTHTHTHMCTFDSSDVTPSRFSMNSATSSLTSVMPCECVYAPIEGTAAAYLGWVKVRVTCLGALGLGLSVGSERGPGPQGRQRTRRRTQAGCSRRLPSDLLKRCLAARRLLQSRL